MNAKSYDLAFFLYAGKRLHTFCTPFAHLPKSGAFLRKVCTACFPLHKNGTCRGEAPPSAIADRSVTQTPQWGVCCFANAKTLGEQGSRQLSAFVCIHQPNGFKDLLTGDFCCRRLFVLPGLGCCRGQVLGIEVCLDLLGQLQPGLVLCVGVGVHQDSSRCVACFALNRL